MLIEDMQNCQNETLVTTLKNSIDICRRKALSGDIDFDQIATLIEQLQRFAALTKKKYSLKIKTGFGWTGSNGAPNGCQLLIKVNFWHSGVIGQPNEGSSLDLLKICKNLADNIKNLSANTDTFAYSDAKLKVNGLILGKTDTNGVEKCNFDYTIKCKIGKIGKIRKVKDFCFFLL